MKERVTRVDSGGGGGGGEGEEEEKMEKFPHYSIDMKSTLPIEVISVDGGGWWIFWSFVDLYTWNFVRTNETTQGHHCIDKILVISNEMRRIVCFRRKNMKLSACLARSHSFHFFRVSGSSVSSLLIKSTNTRTYCTDKICYFTNKILFTDWEVSHVSDGKSAKISVCSLHSLAIIFMGFSRVSGFLVGINHHEKDHITSVTT